MRKFILGCFFALLFSASLAAQSFTPPRATSDQGNTNNNWFFGHQARVCELRRTTLPLSMDR